MPVFEYEAEDRAGEVVHGTIDAATVAEAAALLEAQALTVTAVRQAADAGFVGHPPQLEKAVRRLLDGGEAFLEPLRAYASEAPRRQRRVELRKVIGSLEAGDFDRAVDAAATSPSAWSAVLAAASDEEATFLPRLVERERLDATPADRRSYAFAYPVAVVVLAVSVLWPITGAVLPLFSSIYNEFGLDLPAATLFVLTASRWFTDYCAPLLVLGVAVVGAWWLVTLLGLPIWWSLPVWLRPLLSGLGRRVGLPWTPGVASTAAGLRTVADLVEAGVTRDAAVGLGGDEPRGWRPAAAQALQAPAAGEPSALLLRDLADCYAERSARRVSWFVSLGGPVAILVVAFIVGFVVLALLLPLIGLVRGLS